MSGGRVGRGGLGQRPPADELAVHPPPAAHGVEPVTAADHHGATDDARAVQGLEPEAMLIGEPAHGRPSGGWPVDMGGGHGDRHGESPSDAGRACVYAYGGEGAGEGVERPTLRVVA
ncbi:MAG: hypothetical protein AB7N91_10160 [Candidatus Tectimicrobiota bacterium]